MTKDFLLRDIIVLRWNQKWVHSFLEYEKLLPEFSSLFFVVFMEYNLFHDKETSTTEGHDCLV